MDTNPEGEVIEFEPSSSVSQEGYGNSEITAVAVTIDKSYDNGVLPASTIGIIVGVILAFLLLLLALLLLCCWMRRCCCFGEKERVYGTKETGITEERTVLVEEERK